MNAAAIALCVVVAGGALPDRNCTPGSVAPKVTKEHLCDHSYTATRHVSWSMKRKVFAMYGMKMPKSGHWEIDHLVPRCLGGADAITNLWPQRDPSEKDRIEFAACRSMCAGELGLDAAREQFRNDWRAFRRTP